MSYRNSFIALAALLAFSGSPAQADCTSCKGGTQVAKAQSDIVATASDAGQFKTLLAAAEAAGLVGALQGPGPLTVFAPNDAAFAKLPKGAVEALLADPEKLKAVLTYHVVAGKLSSADVLGGAALVTLQGESLKASSENGKAKIDEAAIVKTDIQCSNGVIHVIDTVLMPK